MNVFRNLKVGSKILSGYCVILVLMVMTTVYFIHENDIAVEKFVVVVEHDTPVVENSEVLKATTSGHAKQFSGLCNNGPVTTSSGITLKPDRNSRRSFPTPGNWLAPSPSRLRFWMR